jgi:hypothetical protein
MTRSIYRNHLLALLVLCGSVLGLTLVGNMTPAAAWRARFSLARHRRPPPS